MGLALHYNVYISIGGTPCTFHCVNHCVDSTKHSTPLRFPQSTCIPMITLSMHEIQKCIIVCLSKTWDNQLYWFPCTEEVYDSTYLISHRPICLNRWSYPRNYKCQILGHRHRCYSLGIKGWNLFGWDTKNQSLLGNPAP